jgi:hypothetical protein
MNKQAVQFTGFLGIGIALIAIAFMYYQGKQTQELKNDKTFVSTFEECVAAGNSVLESYPEQCVHNGQTYTRDIGNTLEKADLIQLQKPQPGAVIGATLELQGIARGYWYFEASFPFEVRDAAGTLVYESYVQAQDEWMTEDFVPFQGTYELPQELSGKGTLILKKDNPSGLPQHDDSLEIPVIFE